MIGIQPRPFRICSTQPGIRQSKGTGGLKPAIKVTVGSETGLQLQHQVLMIITGRKHQLQHTSVPKLYTPLELRGRSRTLPCYICTLGPTKRQIQNSSVLHLYTTLQLRGRYRTLSCYICALRSNSEADSELFHASSVHYAPTQRQIQNSSMLHLYTMLQLRGRSRTLPCFICTLC
jgi:cbb3-type cytochrome oxidase cytochrome c subunit